MKKKYGDLTIKEVQEICEHEDSCWTCPLRDVCPKRFDLPAHYKEDKAVLIFTFIGLVSIVFISLVVWSVL